MEVDWNESLSLSSYGKCFNVMESLKGFIEHVLKKKKHLRTKKGNEVTSKQELQKSFDGVIYLSYLFAEFYSVPHSNFHLAYTVTCSTISRNLNSKKDVVNILNMH